MTKLLKCDVAVMGSGVAGMGAAYKLANAGGLKIAVFEKYPAQGGAVSNCPMSFCSTPDTPDAQKSAYEVFAVLSVQYHVFPHRNRTDIPSGILLATDPDADRLGVYVKDSKTGEYHSLTGNMSGCLIGAYEISQRKEKQGLKGKAFRD